MKAYVEFGDQNIRLPSVDEKEPPVGTTFLSTLARSKIFHGSPNSVESITSSEGGFNSTTLPGKMPPKH